VLGENGSPGGAHGVVGVSYATGLDGSAIYAQSHVTDGIALFATNSGTDATIVATNGSSGVIYKGFSNGGTEVFEVNAKGLTLPTISSAAITTTSVCVDGSRLLVLCNASSRELKADIEPMAASTAGLFDLRPVRFRYRNDPPDAAPLHYGLIAQEVEKIFPDLVLRDRDGRISGVRYEELSSMLVNELQREHAQVRTLRDRLDALERELQSIALRSR
jgi:hypothetical protein